MATKTALRLPHNEHKPREDAATSHSARQAHIRASESSLETPRQDLGSDDGWPIVASSRPDPEMHRWLSGHTNLQVLKWPSRKKEAKEAADWTGDCIT